MRERLTIMGDSNDFTIPVLPPRSKLYHLEPIGVGTPEVESLTGYIARLAEAHCITVYVFFKNLILPIQNNPSVFIERSMGITRDALTLNGMGLSAVGAVRALETLTMRTDLRLLTLLPWSKSLSSFHLVKRNRVWCPACFAEWSTTNRIIYEPLIWTLKVVEVCVRHQYRLRADCPHCGKIQPWFTNRSRPGYCSKCKNWLGVESIDAKPEADETDEGKYQAWVAESIGMMLSAAPRVKTPPTKESGTKSIAKCVEALAKGDAKSFAEFIGVSPDRVRKWIGGAQPQLSTILQICHKTDLGLIEYLTGNVDHQELAERIKLPAKTKSSEGWSKNRKMITDWKKLENYLNSLLRRNKNIPSVGEIARRRKIRAESLHGHFPDLCRLITLRHREQCFMSEQQTLKTALKNTPPQSLEKVLENMGSKHSSSVRKRHPELCKAISQRFNLYTKEQMARTKEGVRREIRKAAVVLHREGRRPSFKEVGARLPIPSCLCNEEERNILREVQTELGYR